MDQVAISGNGFVLAESGTPFVPRGFNYDHDARMRFIEDYWDAEWPLVEKHFAEMARIGANVVRVHPQFSAFMEGPRTARPHLLDQWARLLDLAERTGLYLDVTGLGCYRPGDIPGWFNALDESGRWDAQAAFWGAITERSAGSPAVFCYDLLNEPFVASAPRSPGSWLTGELAGFYYGHYISLDPAGRTPWDISREWIGRMTSAIRAHDPRRLITIGLDHHSPDSLTAFAPDRIADLLDFFCLHCYPHTSHGPDSAFSPGREMEELRKYAAIRPTVIDEIYPLGCTSEELRAFIRDTEGVASGWISFYWGGPEEGAGPHFLP